MKVIHKGAAILIAVFCIQGANASPIFSETFDNYGSFTRESGTFNRGLPKQSEGSDEVWYGARFPTDGSGTIPRDIGVLKSGGAGNATPVGRIEDNAGILFKIPAGYQEINLSFDWRTHDIECLDRLKVGYITTNNLINSGTKSFQNQGANWWDNEWTQLMSKADDDAFTSESFDILSDNSTEEIWISFWLDNGDGDKGMVDNITVTVIPEPTTTLLFAFSAVAIGGCRKIFRV